MPKFLYPKTNYLGPGNPYPNGPPQSSADSIAKKHDKSYIEARSDNDILESDWKYTKEFASDFVKQPSIQSAVGAVGLGLKTGAERVIGVQYPDMKRGGTGKPGGSSIKKHQSGSITSSEMDVDTEGVEGLAEGGATATSGGAGSGDGRSTFIFSPIKQNPEYMTRTLTKTYHFFTTNDLPSYTKVAAQGANGIQLQLSYIQAPPVDRLRLYMSPREEAMFREQFTEVNCEGVSVNIFSLGARGQFTTGGTTATNANMQLQPFIAEFPGLDRDFETTVSESQIETFLGRLEGSNPYDIANATAPTTNIPDFPARTGARKMVLPLTIQYSNPFSYNNNTGTALTSAVQNKLNWPNLYEYANMQNGAVLCQGSPTFQYAYKPKNKYLFGRNTYTRHEAFEATSAGAAPFTIMTGNNEFYARSQDTQGALSGGTNNSEINSGDYIMARNPQPKDVRIENQFQHNSTEPMAPARMPRFLFGVMPLRNIDESNQQIQFEFLMNCTITLRCKMGAPGMYGHTMDYPEPMFMYPTIQKGDYGNFGAISGGSTNTGSQIGTFNNRRNMFGRPTFNTTGTVTILQATGSTVNGISPTMLTRSRKKRQEEQKVKEV